MRRKTHNVQSRVLLVFAVLRYGESPLFTCEDVVSLAWSITQVADAVFFRSVVVALVADLMVKTVGGQARSCVSQLVVRFHPICIDHGFSGIDLPPYIILLLPPVIQQCLEGVYR
jgi:hypothetical protein